MKPIDPKTLFRLSVLGPLVSRERLERLSQEIDALAAIAARALPGTQGADEQLLSWNLHLAARRTIGLLPSDIGFTEPPPPR